MKYQMIAYTPVGKFISSVLDISSQDKEVLEDLLQSDLTYLSIDTDSGKIYLKKDLLSNSVIEIIEIKE